MEALHGIFLAPVSFLRVRGNYTDIYLFLNEVYSYPRGEIIGAMDRRSEGGFLRVLLMYLRRA